MLHRGIYSDAPVAVPEVQTKRTLWERLIQIIGIDENYTRGDKIIAWSVFIYSFVYTFCGCFLGVIAWNIFSPWPIEYWSRYFFIVNLLVPGIVAAVSTVWFSIGGIIDLRKMFRDLAARVDNPLDDGRVNGHVSLDDYDLFM